MRTEQELREVLRSLKFRIAGLSVSARDHRLKGNLKQFRLDSKIAHEYTLQYRAIQYALGDLQCL